MHPIKDYNRQALEALFIQICLGLLLNSQQNWKICQCSNFCAILPKEIKIALSVARVDLWQHSKYM